VTSLSVGGVDFFRKEHTDNVRKTLFGIDWWIWIGALLVTRGLTLFADRFPISILLVLGLPLLGWAYRGRMGATAQDKQAILPRCHRLWVTLFVAALASLVYFGVGLPVRRQSLSDRLVCQLRDDFGGVQGLLWL
jgi:hypothetical protein